MLREKDAPYLRTILTIVVFLIVILVTIFSAYSTEYDITLGMSVILLLFLLGLGINQPNEASVIILFGKYIGTVRYNGLFMTLPFTKKRKIDLRTENKLVSEMIVNDKNEQVFKMSLFLTFNVVDTVKVLYVVSDYELFIKTIYLAILEEHQLTPEVTEETITEICQEVHLYLQKYGIEVIASRLQITP